MKKNLYMLLTMSLAISSQATVYLYNSATDGGFSATAIPDNNYSGAAFNANVVSGSWAITDVKVGLNITGGYNGDLFGYLIHGAGYTVLLNRVGRGTGSDYGFSTSGMNIFLHDSATLNGNIHGVSSPVSGQEYIADGRTVLPFVGPSSLFDAPGVANPLASFNGLTPNGTWTLFLADMSGGGVSTLAGWSLEITAVPEPVTVALGIFGGLFGIVQCVRYIRRRTSAAQ